MNDLDVSESGGPFRRRLMLLLLGIGVVAFVLTLVLGAYAPSLKSGKDGGTHALSNAAIGFSGIVRLAEATGRAPRVVRNARQLDGEELAVVTPGDGAVPLDEILTQRGPRATLIVLPKWRAQRRESPQGWVNVDGTLPPFMIENVLSPTFPIKLSRRRTDRASLEARSPLVPSAAQFREPSEIQTFAGESIEPLVVDSRGATVLGKVGKGNLYLLSDPDLINNHGLADRRQAAAALALLDDLNSTDADGVLFDVSANGFGGTRNPLQLLFGPPFLAVTLIIFAALLLAGWQALIRFGEPRLPARAIALGKTALVDNSASLVRKAGREVAVGARYADLLRERGAALSHLPPTATSPEIDESLDRLRPEQPFSQLALAIGQARTRNELTAAARALHGWLQEVQK